MMYWTALTVRDVRLPRIVSPAPPQCRGSLSRTPKSLGHANHLRAMQPRSGDRAGHCRPVCPSNTPGALGISESGYLCTPGVDAKSNRARKSPCDAGGRRGRVGRADFARAADSDNPSRALARISHTHKKHRSPGDVKFMYGMNLTRFPTEDRCPHTVSPFPWHFKGARGAG